MCGKLSNYIYVLLRVCLLTLLGATALVSPSFCQQRVETTAETNSQIAQLAKQSPPIISEYKLGSGDLVNVDVFDVPQLSRDVRVSDTGFISLPLLPERIVAKGLSTMQLQEKIAELLKASGLVTYPEVTVTLKEQRSQPITIIGSVKTPQVIQSLRPMSVLEVLSDVRRNLRRSGQRIAGHSKGARRHFRENRFGRAGPTGRSANHHCRSVGFIE